MLLLLLLAAKTASCRKKNIFALYDDVRAICYCCHISILPTIHSIPLHSFTYYHYHHYYHFFVVIIIIFLLSWLCSMIYKPLKVYYYFQVLYMKFAVYYIANTFNLTAKKSVYLVFSQGLLSKNNLNKTQFFLFWFFAGKDGKQFRA